ncbi:MAG: alpha/beta hydrolase [Candidatus Hodarchaeota archaeon]
MQDSPKKTLPGAGPFYFEGSKTGIIMIHGFGGGTCADLKPIAQDLHQLCGYTINVPLLPGFGTSPFDLRKTSISEWKSALNEEIIALMDKCDKIIMGGHSMGGVLTLISASNYNLDGIFTISPPVGIKSFLFHLVPFFKIFVKYHSVDSDRLKKDTNEKWVGYNKIPINIATKVKKLMKEMKKSLPKVKCPTLLFQGRLDNEIKKKSMDYIFSHISSKNKRKIWLENNEHSILESPDHDVIVSELINFVKEI